MEARGRIGSVGRWVRLGLGLGLVQVWKRTVCCHLRSPWPLFLNQNQDRALVDISRPGNRAGTVGWSCPERAAQRAAVLTGLWVTAVAKQCPGFGFSVSLAKNIQNWKNVGKILKKS